MYMHRKDQKFRKFLKTKAQLEKVPRNRMRIVCLSDTHCRTDYIEVPDGDVLIVAGDVCSRGHDVELDYFEAFLGQLPHKHKLLVAGNHDFPFEHAGTEKAKTLVKNAIYLENSGIEIDGVKFWGSPWQPEFYDWAFNLPRGRQLAEMWALIPDDTDVLITHTPPYGVLDRAGVLEKHFGCADLRHALKRVRPKLHVFGHIHEDYGVEEVDGTTFINACICDESYRPVNAPIVFDL